MDGIGGFHVALCSRKHVKFFPRAETLSISARRGSVSTRWENFGTFSAPPLEWHRENVGQIGSGIDFPNKKKSGGKE